MRISLPVGHPGVHDHRPLGLRNATFKDDDLRARLQNEAGTDAIEPGRLFPFTDLETNVRRQIQKVRSHP